MFRTIDDFLKTWKYESESTVKTFEFLTDESLQHRVSPNGRTLGYLAWHIVLTIPELMGHAKVSVDGPAQDAPAPATVSEIVSAYQSASNSLVEQVPASWPTESLAERIPMYGAEWAKGEALFALIVHQTHHRGQMTVVMRQLGLPVTGIYGPAQHQWALMGLPPMP